MALEPQLAAPFEDPRRATSKQWVHALRPFHYDSVDAPLLVRIWQQMCFFAPAALFCLWCVGLASQLYWQPINCIVMCNLHLCWCIIEQARTLICSKIALNKILSASANTNNWDCGRALCEDAVGLNHAVFVCAYNENMDVLRETLVSIATQKGHGHSYARRHIGVCLCMEAREGQDGENKATKLVQEMQDKFAWMEITYHPDKLPGEIQGKCSNLQWAITSAESRIGADCLITCCDADSMFDRLYFSTVSAKFVELGAAGTSTIFQPTIMHFLNVFEQTHVVRASSIFISVFFAGSLEDALVFTLPYSTFTVTSDFMRRIHGWDVDYLNDDWHTGTKAFVALPTTVQIIHIPFPVVNCAVEADTWLGALIARWKQAKRHALGVEELSYLLQMLPVCHSKLMQEVHPTKNACAELISMYTRFMRMVLFVTSVHIRFALIIPCGMATTSILIGVLMDRIFGTQKHFPFYGEEPATFMTPSYHPSFLWGRSLGVLLALIVIGKASIAVSMLQHLLSIRRIGHTGSLPWWARSSLLMFIYNFTSITIGIPVMAVCGSLVEIKAIFKVAWWNKRSFEFFVAPKIRDAVHT